MDQHAVILVASTNHAIKIERVLRAAGIDCKLVPVPRHLSSDCGVCVRFSQKQMDAARALIETHHLAVEAVVPL